MPSFLSAALLSLGAAHLAASQTVNCNSMGIPDGYQGFDKWRATTKDCSEATNKLEEHFGQAVPEASFGCVSLAISGGCEVSMCDSSDVRRNIDYTAAWTAARVIHARHKADGKVAGYISLDDYSDAGGFKVFVKVAATDSPNPTGKRKRSLFGRPSALNLGEREEPKEVEARAPSDETSTLPAVEKRWDWNWFSKDSWPIDHTGLYTNIRTAWGTEENIGDDQVLNAMENLLTDWNNVQGNPSSLTPPAYHAPNDMRIQFEWAAHNNHNVNDIGYEERIQMLHWAVQERRIHAPRQNFSMQVRRGNVSVGHLIIRVFWVGQDESLSNVCN
ncbi:hypothetical protein VD0002_g644 [Verticillium dahliae]|uniref:Ecp2 effector protein domain-containing protein n=2 Tax=Verticillium dahliae TaxID=27337 RepID=G2X2Q8_VERDV|nr:uncharacterized protein VDAG_04102 [Verticillium dahliae VdLs.17]KAF3346500.1 Ubiquitin carboxyl-terminal hydrolase 5 [Verticillium dahliae VDG2]KAH6686570.1 hypothetical protein EV126DRAFT_526549 [Verticillium dahliae]EGY22664.1 hypothetical protein VDAG_04102 [Verticillium dahliae VdLs.17]PNH34744.1 hypothetical protein BJF96_g1978 [Verticillium dahliae]PNH41870.1 hypothetical protein VD0004_g5327 [Verticillium dahliae]